MLAYLALQRGQWFGRRQLAELLWPQLEAAAALTNLRQVLTVLLRAINTASETELLRVERDRLCLIEGAALQVDAAQLLALLPLDEEPAADQLQLHETLLLGPQADLLDSLQLEGCGAFDDWLQQQRARLLAQRRRLLLALQQAQRSQGRPAAAAQSARLRWQLDPLDEPAAAALIRLLLDCGDRRGAQQVLATLDQALVSALGQRADASLRRLLDDVDEPLPVIAPPPSPAAGERRWLALLQLHAPVIDACADEEEELAEQAMTELLPLLQAVQLEVRRWGGHLQPWAAAGQQISFGLQGSAEQAGLRCLLLAQALQRLPGAATRLAMAATVGMASCSRLDGQPQAFGPLPQQVRQLAQMARPGEVLLAPAVLELLGPRLLLSQRSDAGGQALSALQQVLAAAPPVLAAPVCCPGRELLLQRLKQRWQATLAGQPGWVVLRGEAGLGKTSLAAHFAETLGTQGVTVLRWSCRIEWQHRPLAPLCEALASAEAPLRALLPGEAAANEAPSRSRWFEAVFEWLDQLCTSQPCLLLVDDLQWADASTRELLARYAAIWHQQRLLLLVTSRPEVALECAGAEPELLDLPPLPAPAAAALLQRLDPAGQLDAQARATLIANAAGVPLFIEALARRQLDGAAELPLAELMQAELDRLGAFKPVLQGAAVIGQRFEAPLLQALLPEFDIAGVLQLAESSRLIVALRGADGEVYQFRHALLHEAALAGQLPLARRALHARLAELLLAAAAPAERLAPQWQAAQRWTEALMAWWQAGEAALAREFAAEAQAHLQQAWTLLQARPELIPGLARQRLALSLVRAAQMNEGFGSPLAHRLSAQVLAALDAEPGEPTAEQEALHFSALAGLYMGAGSQGQSLGLVLAERMAQSARRDEDRLMAEFALGNSLFWRGRFAEALTHQQAGLALAAALTPAQRGHQIGDDLAVLLQAFRCWTLWFLGASDSARAAAAAGLEQARAGGQAHALCFMLSFAAAMSWTAGDEASLRRHAGEGLALARRHGFALWQGINGLFMAWAAQRQGEPGAIEAALRAAEQMHEAYQAGRTTARWVLAASLIRLCASAAADELPALLAQSQALLQQALADALVDEDHYCRPALLMLLSECERRRGDWQAAAQLADEACAMARSQGAAGWLRRHAPAAALGLPG
ncbi:AAA family ATPase [Paucibacter sp. APW11]|uniref:AAA family ATPase n=1 Tax=Roseateles aquae TaxID=3077235 RepID=A0ABU3PAY7_9BURK|nr:AAA family ATPase [Paucibacter sp. APW11]MDT8999390.1 AAA family ATPase [Paucibacter sp. APW11]